MPDDIRWIQRFNSYKKAFAALERKEGSDIDITIKGSLVFGDLVKLSTKLDNLNLPWKIDLSLYDQITSKELLDHIDRIGVKIARQDENEK